MRGGEALYIMVRFLAAELKYTLHLGGIAHPSKLCKIA